MAELDAEVADTVKRLTAELVAELVEETPVDTGWARANWIPRIGPGGESPVGAPGSSSEAARESALAEVVTRYRVTDGVVTIQNNVPYVPFLFLGTVRMAPKGSIEAAIARAQAAVLGGF